MSENEVSGSGFFQEIWGELIRGDVFGSGFFLGGNCPGGNCPGGVVRRGSYRSLDAATSDDIAA